eukprot:RCo009054
MALEAIQYSRGSLRLLNQRLLPGQAVFEDVQSCEEAFSAILEMKVRGAPAIAITAVLSLAVEAHRVLATPPQARPESFRSVDLASAALCDKLRYLCTSRPTAVNLRNAVTSCTAVIERCPKSAEVDALLLQYIEAAEAIYAEDVAITEGISKHGSEYILRHCRSDPSQPVCMLTHCNTGSLATSKYGTALGVIRFLHSQGQLARVFCTETRPYNQGARLTAFECVTEKMNTTLIVDSCVAFLMRRKQINAVVVGADRVCNNGDTANKIGTLQVALSAKHFGVPFFVAAPTTTLDFSLSDGSQIKIEERSPSEITDNPETGHRMVVASPLLEVWNPSFDVTPAELITGIITEVGVALPQEGKGYDLAAWLSAQRQKAGSKSDASHS